MVQSCAPPQTRSYTLSKMRGSLRRNHAKLKACLFAKHALNLTHTHSFFFFGLFLFGEHADLEQEPR